MRAERTSALLFLYFYSICDLQRGMTTTDLICLYKLLTTYLVGCLLKFILFTGVDALVLSLRLDVKPICTMSFFKVCDVEQKRYLVPTGLGLDTVLQ
jgi:hypothetical protein